MANTSENETLATSLGAKLEKSKGLVLTVGAIVLVLVAAVLVFATVRAKSISNGIERVDSISYALTNESEELSDSDIAARQNKALEELVSLGDKSGIVGLRANMLIAEIKFAQKNYEEARSAWLKAANLNKKAYTASVCFFNAALCSEELNDSENAIAYYKLASEDENFLLIDHALFSLGRVNETAQKYEEAKETYQRLYDLHSTSNWGLLAKSRLIALKAAGNIQ